MEGTLTTVYIGTIMMLYPIFFARLYDHINDYDKISKLCDEIKYDDKNHSNCHDIKRELIERYSDTKFIYMMLIGFVSLLVGTFAIVKLKDNRITPAATGICIGSLIIFCYYLFMNWTKFNSRIHLIVMAMILIGIITGSYFYNSY